MNRAAYAPPRPSAPAPPERRPPRRRQNGDLIHTRVRLGFMVFAIGYLCIAARLVYIQLFRHRFYQAQAARIREHTFLLPATRGSILDRDGIPLAIEVEVGDVIADPTEVSNPASTASVLAQLVPGFDPNAASLAIDAAQKTKTASGDPVRFLILEKAVPFARVQAIRAALEEEEAEHASNPASPVALAGISISTRQVRSYPNGDLASQVIGFVNAGTAGDPSTASVSGRYGVEASMNAVLAGRDGSETAETDAQGRVIPGAVIDKMEPVPGSNVRLTIDATIQRIAQDELYKSFSAHHARMGTVVVLDPTDGDILAMANVPTFNPNHLAGTSNLEWHDAAVTDLYEPGSTMKALTFSAVLNILGLGAMNDTIDCTGSLRVGNHIIHCAPDPPLYGVHGVEHPREILENSCNIGAALFAMKIGAENLFEYDRKFGLLHRPHTGLPDEEYSHLIDPAVKPWSKIELANIAFGQGISLTPLQLASIYATIANNGVLVHPHILLDSKPQGPPQQVIRPDVARAMLSMLQSVVEKGTGLAAQIAGYNIGGKTGSAQVAEHGHYGNQYIGSFIGVVPITHPRLVILCVIDEPQGVHWGAVVAAPVVHNIAERALWYLKVPPDNPAKVDYADRNRARVVTIHRRRRDA